MAFDESYIAQVIVGKLISGVFEYFAGVYYFQ